MSLYFPPEDIPLALKTLPKSVPESSFEYPDKALAVRSKSSKVPTRDGVPALVYSILSFSWIKERLSAILAMCTDIGEPSYLKGNGLLPSKSSEGAPVSLPPPEPPPEPPELPKVDIKSLSSVL